VIIPAHNEEAVIASCLRSLIDQSTERLLRIIVVANGCQDATAACARELTGEVLSRGFDLEVIELSGGGKPAALNRGDQSAPAGMRIYLDADVRLSPDAVEGVAETLEAGGALLAAPAVLVATGRAWATRSYSKVWQSLPLVGSGVIGAGVYSVSEEGRQRWGRFPDIHSDDKFVRLCFADHERRVAHRGHFLVQMPEGFRELLAVRTRWCRGNRELARRFPSLATADRREYLATAKMLTKRPDLWTSVPLFLLVFGVAYGIIFLGLFNTVKWRRALRARALLGGQTGLRTSKPVQG